MTIEQRVLKEILSIEWDMFQAVQGIDGPASCQQDRKTFDIMRSSQLLGWNDEVAQSYLEDLTRARAGGRNLMTEKYARMMEYTSPCEFRRISGGVPELDQDAPALIQRLTERSVRWMEELAVRYPHVLSRGRPIRSDGDNRFTPSFETYTRGELATYSVKTLQLLEDYYLEMAAEGNNPAEIILRHTAESSGFASLERAEAAQRARMEESF